MKASQITTRNRKNVKVIRSLATVAVLTFFVAGPADARCRNQVQIESRFLTTQNQDIRGLGVHNIKDDYQDIYQDLYTIPRVDVIRDGNGHTNGRRPIRGNGRDGRLMDFRNITPMYGNTTIPINDDPTIRRRKEEERAQRRAILEELKRAGVLTPIDQPATTTKTGNSTGTTTTKPKPKPAPKPKPKPKKPKVTKLPNGDTITDYPDGRREIKMKNGDTVTTHKNGKRVIKKSNGDTTETHPTGYRKTTNRYGDGTAHFPDGTRIDFRGTGEATLTTKDGRKFHREPGKGFKEVD